jgi:hypothetical protein
MTLKQNGTEQQKTPQPHRNGNQGSAQPRTPHRRILVHLLLLSSRFEYQVENSKVEYTYGWHSASAGII